MLYLCWVVAQIALDPIFHKTGGMIDLDGPQNDFLAYYTHAKDYAAGGNLYSDAYLKLHRGYQYPPHSLWFFWLFTLMKIGTAYYLFLFLKCMLLVWLMYLWRAKFIGEDCDALFFIFCILAYNSALFHDIMVGNVTVMEQCVLWSAFYSYLRKKLIPFCVLIVFLASWRIAEVYFLILLLFSTDKKRYLYMVRSFVALALIIFFSFLKNPDVYASSVKVICSYLVGHGEGPGCPSSYYFLKNLFGMLAQKTGLVVPQPIVWGFYMGIVVMVISLTYQTSIRVRDANEGSDLAKIYIYLNCLTYVLILPHISEYWYVILIVPTYYVIKHATQVSAYIPLFILASLSIEGIGFCVGISGLMWNYHSLLIAYAMWGIFICMLWRGTTRAYERAPAGDERKSHPRAG